MRAASFRPARCSASRPWLTLSRLSARSNTWSAKPAAALRRSGSCPRPSAGARRRHSWRAGAGQQIDHAILRGNASPANAWPSAAASTPARPPSNNIALVLNFARMVVRIAPASRRPRLRGMLPCAHEDLPQADQRLHGAGGVRRAAPDRESALMACAVSRNAENGLIASAQALRRTADIARPYVR